MKQKYFHQKVIHAAQGILSAARLESNFRIELLCAVGAVALLIWLQPPPIWWALFAVTIAGVLSLELVNTALEKALDQLHPERDPLIGVAKDCAAGAVLIMSIASLVVAASLLWMHFAA